MSTWHINAAWETTLQNGDRNERTEQWVKGEETTRDLLQCNDVCIGIRKHLAQHAHACGIRPLSSENSPSSSRPEKHKDTTLELLMLASLLTSLNPLMFQMLRESTRTGPDGAGVP